MFIKIYDEPLSPKEGACFKIYGERLSPTAGVFKIYEDIWPILATRTGSVHRGPENHKKYPKKSLSLAYPCDSYRFLAIEGQKTIKNTQKKP